jgi:hypothetical protein
MALPLTTHGDERGLTALEADVVVERIDIMMEMVE